MVFNMTNVYIVSTPYHLLISMVKILQGNRIGQDELVIQDKSVFSSNLCHNVEKIFKKVVVCNKSPTYLYFHILMWRNRCSRKIPFLYNKLKKYSNIDESLFNGREIFIYHDYSSLACLLNISKIEYNLVEDGLNRFQYSLSSFKKTRSRLYPIWERLLGVSWKPFGHSKYVKSIEVNDEHNLRIKHPNILVVNRAQLFRSLTQDDINMIAQIFDYQPIGCEISEESTLLLTQPLAEDNLLSHSKKIALYQYLVKKYNVGKLYIKVHPREREDYTKIFPNAVILGNNGVPFELLLLKENFHFKRAITAFSTAIDAVFCADEKIQMGQEWTLNF